MRNWLYDNNLESAAGDSGKHQWAGGKTKQPQQQPTNQPNRPAWPARTKQKAVNFKNGGPGKENGALAQNNGPPGKRPIRPGKKIPPGGKKPPGKKNNHGQDRKGAQKTGGAILLLGDPRKKHRALCENPAFCGTPRGVLPPQKNM